MACNGLIIVIPQKRHQPVNGTQSIFLEMRWERFIKINHILIALEE